MKQLRLSYSAVQDWRQCPQLYWYRYVEKLRPKVRQAAPELGTLIHTYFERYYGDLQREGDPRSSHNAALDFILQKSVPEIRSLASLADSLGAEEEAKKLLALPKTARRLLNAYYRVHGRTDAQEHKILAVERKFELPVIDGIVLPGQIDLVTRNKDGVWLWEHKTTGSIPSQGRRFRDLQTLLYKVAVEELLLHHELTGLIWNYVHTTPPQPPKLLRNGTLSVAQHQTTTVGLYRAAIKKAGLDAYKYGPFLRRIERRERQVMFPRYTLPIVQSEEVLLRDYAASVHQIADAHQSKSFAPVRNIAAHCDWCPMLKLCQAAIAGGDTDDLMRRHYTTEEKKERKSRGEP